jgi:hypothetical protein
MMSISTKLVREFEDGLRNELQVTAIQQKSRRKGIKKTLTKYGTNGGCKHFGTDNLDLGTDIIST